MGFYHLLFEEQFVFRQKRVQLNWFINSGGFFHSGVSGSSSSAVTSISGLKWLVTAELSV